MQAAVTITYDAHDIRRTLLANAPQEAQLQLYRSISINVGEPQLVAIIRIPGAAEDPDALAWTPYSTSYTAGQDAILLIDHATLTDILLAAAIDVLSASGLKVANPQSATVSVHDHDLSVAITFPLEDLRVPQRALLSTFR